MAIKLPTKVIIYAPFQQGNSLQRWDNAYQTGSDINNIFWDEENNGIEFPSDGNGKFCCKETLSPQGICGELSSIPFCRRDS